MSFRGFLVTALGQALELAIATPDDVLRHVTPEILATHLPRPLWTRLLTACLGAGRVDAALVVDTIGIDNLCEHIPASILWGCVHEVGERSLAGEQRTPIIPAPPRGEARAAGELLTPPPPAETRAAPPPAPAPVPGPSIPAPNGTLADVVASLEAEERGGEPARSRAATQNRFRPGSTALGRLNAVGSRRPQAAAAPPEAANGRSGRNGTEADFEAETVVGGKDDWKAALAVEDDALVEWSATEETPAPGDDSGRKR